MGVSRHILKICRGTQLNSDSSGSGDLSSCYSGFWGSAEEYEVQKILQEIVASSLNSSDCYSTLIQLRGKLTECSTGWIDRFVISQGITILHKLLADANVANDDDIAEYLDHELVLIQCFNILYTRSIVAQQMFSESSNQQVLNTILRSLISPEEETRRLASETIMSMKSAPGNPYKALQTLTVIRRRQEPILVGECGCPRNQPYLGIRN